MSPGKGDRELLPAELPEKPTGWTKGMTLHINYGEDGGAALYEVHDPEGNRTGIVYQYDTRKAKPAKAASGRKKGRPAFTPPKTGFHVPAANTEVFERWADLHKAWPEILRAAASLATVSN